MANKEIDLNDQESFLDKIRNYKFSGTFVEDGSKQDFDESKMKGISLTVLVETVDLISDDKH